MALYEKEYVVSEKVRQELVEICEAGVQVEDAREDELLYYITVEFEDGIEADIKLYNSDSGPWVDAYLVDKFGNCTSLIAPDDDIFGEYNFYDNGNEYRVVVK